MENFKSPIVAQNKTIGENIKAARKAQGITQRALAKKLGIAFQNLSVRENGKGAPSAMYLLKLSEVLNISLDQLASTEGIKAHLEKSFPSKGKFTGIESINSKEFLESDMPRLIDKSMAENPSIKLIVRYLEDILKILKSN